MNFSGKESLCARRPYLLEFVIYLKKMSHVQYIIGREADDTSLQEQPDDGHKLARLFLVVAKGQDGPSLTVNFGWWWILCYCSVWWRCVLREELRRLERKLGNGRKSILPRHAHRMDLWCDMESMIYLKLWFQWLVTGTTSMHLIHETKWKCLWGGTTAGLQRISWTMILAQKAQAIFYTTKRIYSNWTAGNEWNTF
jgi:hypothetical protein